MQMREKVIVKTATTDLEGELFVGADGMPELFVWSWPDHYRPWTFPRSWSISSKSVGDLYSAWCRIEEVLKEVRDAQREAETEDRDRAQQREMNNRTENEIDERRQNP